MARFEGTRGHVGYVVAVMVATMVALVLPANPARADVNSVSGSAYAASINSSLLGQVLAPSPAGVAGSASEPADGYGPVNGAILPITIPGVLSVEVGPVSTQGGGLLGENHFGFAFSQSRVANVVVGAPILPALTAIAVSSSCRSDGTGSVGATELLGATVAGNPLIQSPLANTPIEVPGVLTAVLNEQIVNNVPGVTTSITVNAVHIQLLPAAPGLPVLDIVLASSTCRADGPNVLIEPTIPTTPTTTPTTLPCDGPCPTTPTTLPCDGPCPTTPTTLPCNGPCPTSPTTLPCNGPCPTSPTSTTIFRPGGGVLPGLPPGGGQGVVIPGPTVVVPFVPQTIVVPTGVLARTGANAWNLLMLAVAALVIGTFLRRSSQATPLLPTEPVTGARQALARLAQRPSRNSW